MEVRIINWCAGRRRREGDFISIRTNHDHQTCPTHNCGFRAQNSFGFTSLFRRGSIDPRDPTAEGRKRPARSTQLYNSRSKPVRLPAVVEEGQSGTDSDNDFRSALHLYFGGRALFYYTQRAPRSRQAGLNDNGLASDGFVIRLPDPAGISSRDPTDSNLSRAYLSVPLFPPLFTPGRTDRVSVPRL